MLDFGKVELVEKTFTREAGIPRGQAFNGIKFRRFESTKGKEKVEKEGGKFEPFTEEQFVISNKAFAQLELETYALAEAKANGTSYLLVVEDQDKVAPIAKFMRQSMSKKEGKVYAKGKFFSNSILAQNLVENGVLDASKHGNQYLALTDVTAQMSNLPEQVKAVYSVAVDTSVDESKDVEVESDADSNEF